MFTSKFKMGDFVKDSVTGFTGIITVYSFYITGNPRVCVEAESVDGKPGESDWFDEERLVYA